jgi:hypothetical protein
MSDPGCHRRRPCRPRQPAWRRPRARRRAHGGATRALLAYGHFVFHYRNSLVPIPVPLLVPSRGRGRSPATCAVTSSPT